MSIYYGEREVQNDSFHIHSEHNLTFDVREQKVGTTESGKQFYSLISKKDGSERFNS